VGYVAQAADMASAGAWVDAVELPASRGPVSCSGRPRLGRERDAYAAVGLGAGREGRPACAWVFYGAIRRMA